MTTSNELSEADRQNRAWLGELINDAAASFGIEPVGEPVYGWYDRSVSTRAETSDGPRWLRIVTEDEMWADEDFWTGNADAAAALPPLPTPVLLNSYDTEQGRLRIRAELFTYRPGEVCSPTPDLRIAPDLPEQWWNDLHDALSALAATPTHRVAVSQERVTRRLRLLWGDRIDPTVQQWTTAHADLHWNNLLGPDLTILDWEMWGQAPAGYDAATLRCYSLTHPELAEKIHATFAEQLDTPDGKLAQLTVIARLLLRSDHGDHSELVLPLHHLAQQLIR